MITLAITGGIGSGKSFVGAIFEELGAPLYLSDDRTKALYHESKELQDELKALLGDEIFKEGILQRQVMASKIFNDSSLLEKVNKIVHPAVLADFRRWKSQQEESGVEVVLLESAIIFDVPIFHKEVDKIVVVTAPKELRVERIIARDGLTREAILARMANQPDEEEIVAKSHFTILADGKEPLLPQVTAILQQLTSPLK